MCDAVLSTNTAAPHPHHRRANAHRSPCKAFKLQFPIQWEKRSLRCMEHSLSVDYNSFSPSSVPFAPNDYVIALPATLHFLQPRLSFGLLERYVDCRKPFSPRQSIPIHPHVVRTGPKYFRHDFRIANSSTWKREKRANLEFPRTSSTSLGNKYYGRLIFTGCHRTKRSYAFCLSSKW